MGWPEIIGIAAVLLFTTFFTGSAVLEYRQRKRDGTWPPPEYEIRGYLARPLRDEQETSDAE